jgi:hypothetical protein
MMARAGVWTADKPFRISVDIVTECRGTGRQKPSRCPPAALIGGTAFRRDQPLVQFVDGVGRSVPSHGILEQCHGFGNAVRFVGGRAASRDLTRRLRH